MRTNIITNAQIGRCPTMRLDAEHWMNVPPGGSCSCVSKETTMSITGHDGRTVVEPGALRPGDRVSLSDGTIVTVDELPWLSGNAVTRARVKFADGSTGLAAWGPRLLTPIAVDHLKG